VGQEKLHCVVHSCIEFANIPSAFEDREKLHCVHNFCTELINVSQNAIITKKRAFVLNGVWFFGTQRGMRVLDVFLARRFTNYAEACAVKRLLMAEGCRFSSVGKLD